LIYKPYLAMVLPGALALASIALLGLGESLWARIGISVVCVAVFVVILFALGIDPRDKAAIAFWAPSKLAKEKGASS
jgi:hypothetical protein